MWGNSYDIDDFLRAAQKQLDEYETHRSRFDTLARETDTRKDDLVRNMDNACINLARTLIPDLIDTSAVNQLANNLGLRELSDLQLEFHQTVSRNLARRQEVEASNEYQNRELDLLRLETRKSELEPLYQHTTLEWQKLQSIERLPSLIERGYGTDQYAHRGLFRFFNAEFLTDWRCADSACEKLSLPTFADVRSQYNDRAEQIRVLGREWEELRLAKNRIENLIEEREQLIRDEADAPSVTYRQMGERIGSILSEPSSVVIDRLPNPDAIRSRLRELSGMKAQTEYLDGLRTQMIQEASAITARSSKLYEEMNRYATDRHRYRNKRFTRDQWDKRFGEQRTARYEPIYGRYRRASDTVYVFNNYDRSSGLSDFLWWDVMTDGRLDGNFLPEVRSWRDENPDYRYDRSTYASTSAFESDNFGNDSFGSDVS